MWTTREQLIETAISELTNLKTEVSVDRVLELVGTLDMQNHFLGVRSWNDVRLIMNQIHFERSKVSI